MNETTKNFLEVWASLEPWQLPEISRRLYHDDQGRPIEYSSDVKQHKYIEVSPEVFRDRPMNVRVVNGQLEFLSPTTVVKKLKPSNTGTCCSVVDVCVVVDCDQPNIRWSMNSNETN